MRIEQLHMSEEQKKQITTMLQIQGISQKEIERIINGDYESYDTEKDLESAYGGIKKHGDVLEKLSDGYTMEELQGQGIPVDKIQQFEKMLDKRNLTVNNAKIQHYPIPMTNKLLKLRKITQKKGKQKPSSGLFPL